MCSFLWLSFPGGSEVKASTCNAGDLGSIPGSGRSPGEGNGNPLQYSCLENPMDRGAWWATVHRVSKSRTRLSDFTFTFLHHSFFIHSSVDGHLDCFHVLSIVSSAAVNIGVQVPFWIIIFSGYMPSSGIVGWYGSFFPSLDWYSQCSLGNYT